MNIVQKLLAEQSPLYIIKTSPQLQDLAIIYDDRQFIERLVAGKPPEDITELLSEYRIYWMKAADAEPRHHCKENAGRFAANTWLRNECK